MNITAKPTVALRLPAAASAAILSACAVLAGCQSDGDRVGGDQPGVIVAQRNASAGAAKTTTRGSAADSASSGRAIASVEGVEVPEAQLNALLYASTGLDALLKLVQLNMAKAEASRLSLTVTPADVAAERLLTMKLAFPSAEPEDFENLLSQLLTQQRVSRAEFDVVMETNANLRAIVRPQAREGITEETIEDEFNQMYGEKVRVRAIPLLNPQDVIEVKRELAQPGVRFEDVARRRGKIPALAQLGGQLQEFTRGTTNFSPVFVEVAFSLQRGQISSDPIQVGQYYYIIKLEDRIAPKAVKLEDVRDSVRESMIARREGNLMALKRQDFAARAIRELKINDPAMKSQFDARIEAANPKAGDKREVQQSLEEQSPTTLPAATTGPADEQVRHTDAADRAAPASAPAAIKAAVVVPPAPASQPAPASRAAATTPAE